MGRAERAQTPGSCSYLGESIEHQALGSVVSPLSLPAGAEPVPLLSAPWPRQPEKHSASAPPPSHASRLPRPLKHRPLRPRPRPALTGRGDSRAAGAERRASDRTGSARPPRPGPNQASRGGVRPLGGRRKRSKPPFWAPRKRGEPQVDAVV
ncbi:uncharacterized protein LOC144330256 [Macaca mulatta]